MDGEYIFPGLLFLLALVHVYIYFRRRKKPYGAMKVMFWVFCVFGPCLSALTMFAHPQIGAGLSLIFTYPMYFYWTYLSGDDRSHRG